MDEKNVDQAVDREWVHSRAEDTDTEMVFRPNSYFEENNIRFRAAPKSFTLKADGTLLETQSAANDARREAEGTWKLKDGKLAFYDALANEPARLLKIVSVSDDRLVIERMKDES